jgi:hypothetical protein
MNKMKHKKIKIGLVVSSLVLISIIPLSFNMLSVPAIITDDNSPKNDEILTDEEYLESAGVFDEIFKIFTYHIAEFDVSKGFGSTITMRVKIENYGGLPLQLVQVKIRMTLNDGSIRTFAKITGTSGWVTINYLNLRINTAGTYTCVITSAVFIFGFLIYRPIDNTVPTTRQITL